jgi:hypothetical protein
MVTNMLWYLNILYHTGSVLCCNHRTLSVACGLRSLLLYTVVVLPQYSVLPVDAVCLALGSYAVLLTAHSISEGVAQRCELSPYDCDHRVSCACSAWIAMSQQDC